MPTSLGDCALGHPKCEKEASASARTTLGGHYPAGCSSPSPQRKPVFMVFFTVLGLVGLSAAPGNTCGMQGCPEPTLVYLPLPLKPADRLSSIHPGVRGGRVGDPLCAWPSRAGVSLAVPQLSSPTASPTYSPASREQRPKASGSEGAVSLDSDGVISVGMPKSCLKRKSWVSSHTPDSWRSPVSSPGKRPDSTKEGALSIHSLTHVPQTRHSPDLCPRSSHLTEGQGQPALRHPPPGS